MNDRLRQVDRIEVLTLMDNYVDLLLESTTVVTRPPKAKGGIISRDALVGEHGLSLLVTVYEGKEKHTVLFDTGFTGIGVLHNAKHLEVDLGEIRTLVMSHRHMDHTGSLWPILELLGRPIPLVIHPDAFIPSRYLLLPDGKKLRYPDTLNRQDLEQAGVEIVESKKPVPVAGGRILVTGEIERRTGFEKGLPNAYTEQDGKLVKDPVSDDQALVIHLKEKGLVVISGCAHAGIINTLLYSRKIAEIDRLYAVLGGFHLSGPLFEPIIEETIESVKKMNPKIVVPMHCTGWKAIHRFEEAFPDAFVLNSVGSTITLSSASAA
ncbi:MAG: MBL fold metallo-hydrolase [Deltaproteobacteria bacterium]|nr:MBL fold metallo-hydrolase [Deltaproteobacteria bacterium]